MIKKFEAFTKKDLDNHYYLGHLINDKEYVEKKPVSQKTLTELDKLSEDDLTEYIKGRIASISWKDLVLIEDITNKYGHYEKVYVWSLPKYLKPELEILHHNYDVFLDKKFRFEIENYMTLNRTHFEVGIPYVLRGIGLGYKLYKAMVNHLGYITSTSSASDDAQKLWSYLIKDPNYYSIVTKKDVIIIDKRLSKKSIENIIIRFLKSKLHSSFEKPDTKTIKDLARHDTIIKVDPELAKDFKHLDFHKLNYDLFKRWKSIMISGIKNNKDEQYPNGMLGQKIYLIKEDKESIITGIEKRRSSENYLVYYCEGNKFSMTRKDFVIISDVNDDIKKIHDMYQIDDSVIYDSSYGKMISFIKSMRISGSDIVINESIAINNIEKVKLKDINNLNEIKVGDSVAVDGYNNKFFVGVITDIKNEKEIIIKFFDGDKEEISQPLNMIYKYEKI